MISVHISVVHIFVDKPLQKVSGREKSDELIDNVQKKTYTCMASVSVKSPKRGLILASWKNFGRIHSLLMGLHQRFGHIFWT